MDSELEVRLYGPLTAHQERRAENLCEWGRRKQSLGEYRQAELAFERQVSALRAMGLDPHEAMTDALARFVAGVITLEKFKEVGRQVYMISYVVH